MSQDSPLWTPTREHANSSRMTAFRQSLLKRHGSIPESYPEFHRWTVSNKSLFWREIVDHFGLIGSFDGPVLVGETEMPGAQWFPEATLNFAENLLQGQDDQLAIIACRESGEKQTLTYQALRKEVGDLVAALLQTGVKPGDRVAGFLPNCAQAVVAMLAATSIGAIWSSCSPDFGLNGVMDRFGQIEPKVLFVTSGYQYNGKHVSTVERVKGIAAKLDKLEKIVVVPFGELSEDEQLVTASGRFVQWSDFLCPSSDEIPYVRSPFSHPLYIMYSSGTTGTPKCIVHSTGGTLLQHVKELALHTNIREGDRVFYYTTCGWMMWNWLVSALALKATIVLYDGSPFWPGPSRLFDLADQERLNVLGASAKFFAACQKASLKPIQTHDLSDLRTLLSTGSPLLHESFDYVYQAIKKDVCLSSISGGTDIISCFALGNPTLPVFRGELQCAGLAMDVAFYDENGNSLPEGKGELVCQSPFPSMPAGFWNDPDGRNYSKAYFSRFPHVWAHGDYGEFVHHDTQDGIIIHGRSDAVLNPGGVRIGTAEIYRQVEKIDEVIESIAIAQDWGNDVRIVLFVKLREGIRLDDTLKNKIKETVRTGASPRHVPAVIASVPDIPRTISGKIVELAVRNVVHGEPVKNQDALANPEALNHFRNRPELQ